MQEYSIPAVVEIAPSASLADVVFERADREPEAVIMRRQADGGGPRAGRFSEGGTVGGRFVPAWGGPRPPSRRAA